MDKIKLLIFICCVQFVSAENPPIVSECYHYHTPHYYEIFTENSHIVFQHTVKDPNGVSYVSRDKVVFDSINSKEFKILGDDVSKILFSTIDGYFYVKKDYREVKNYGVSKIAKSNSITETIGTDLICKNGLWYYMSLKKYSNEIIEKEVKNVPNNLEVYQRGMVRDGTLMKNDEAVYIFNEREFTFKKIPNLTGKNTHFTKINRSLKKGFIYDDDTFYFIGFDELIDYTEEFSSRKEFTNFKNVEIVKHQYEYSINTNDGIIWLYLRFTMKIDTGETVKIAPVKATYLGKNKTFVSFNDKIYNDFGDLLRGYKSIDISAIENPNELETHNYDVYYDGKNNYTYDYDKDKFNIVKLLPKNASYYQPIYTYNNGTSDFYAADKQLYFLANPNKILKTIKYTSALKNLTLAYAYDDKLLIENKEIKSIADRESIEFIGSTVQVISACDGGRGQYPVEIDVYYFFKDKKGIYVYNSTNPKMRKIENQKSSKVKKDDYDYLMQLMKAM